MLLTEILEKSGHPTNKAFILLQTLNSEGFKIFNLSLFFLWWGAGERRGGEPASWLKAKSYPVRPEWKNL